MVAYLFVGVKVGVGDESLPIHLVDKSQPAWADVEAGETDVYNDVTRIRLRANGNVELGAGATKGAIRDGASVVRTIAMQTWMTSVENALTALSIPIPPFPGTAIGAADGGSATVKIKD